LSEFGDALEAKDPVNSEMYIEAIVAGKFVSLHLHHSHWQGEASGDGQSDPKYILSRPLRR